LLLGTAIAWYEPGRFEGGRFFLAVLIGLLIHLVTAWANDLADVQTDEKNLLRSQFSGGSGVIVEGLLTRAALTGATVGAVLLSILLTGILVFLLGVHGGIFLLLGFGLISGLGYSLPPLKLSYRGGGEFLVLLNYGPALVWTGYFVQAGPVNSPLPWALSLPVGLAVFALIAVTQFPDAEADRQAGKRSLVILLGEGPALRLVGGAIGLSLLSVLVFILTGILPRWTGLLSLLGLPLALDIIRNLRGREVGPNELIKITKGSLLLTLWLGIAPAVGLLLDKGLR
jgi:1,4-dihydroxy-2-naphthoate octaprenyltransferase